MIKFFRKIRQKLIEQGKTANYLKYAIGEILLVVIGILIALQINNWNEQRKNSNLEYKYISELQSDLEKDSMEIQKMIKKSNAQVRSKGVLLKYLEHQSDYRMTDYFKSDYQNIIYNEKTASDSILHHFTTQWTTTYNFAPNKTTFDEMKSTGTIGVISNRDLRRALLETYNGYELYKLNEEFLFKKQQEEIWKLVFSRIPGIYHLENSDILPILKDAEVLNRLEGNVVISLNIGLIKLQTINKQLLDKLREYQK